MNEAETHAELIDPVLKAVHWTRRVTLMEADQHELKSMAADLELAEGQWRIAALLSGPDGTG